MRRNSSAVLGVYTNLENLRESDQPCVRHKSPALNDHHRRRHHPSSLAARWSLLFVLMCNQWLLVLCVAAACLWIWILLYLQVRDDSQVDWHNGFWVRGCHGMLTLEQTFWTRSATILNHQADDVSEIDAHTVQPRCPSSYKTFGQH